MKSMFKNKKEKMNHLRASKIIEKMKIIQKEKVKQIVQKIWIKNSSIFTVTLWRKYKSKSPKLELSLSNKLTSGRMKAENYMMNCQKLRN